MKRFSHSILCIIAAAACGFGAPRMHASQPVIFNSSPTGTLTTAKVGSTYHYDADAAALDGSAIHYSLQYGPAGMTVDGATGLVTWFPRSAGSVNVSIRAELVNDPATSATQEWTIEASVPPGNAVGVDPLTFTGACVGSTINVDYTATGTFAPGNAFILQLSDATGSFAGGFQNLGSISSVTSGTIVVTIPPATPPGSNYRVRVMSSNPATIGADNGTDFAIDAKPGAKFGISMHSGTLGGNEVRDGYDEYASPLHILLEDEPVEFADMNPSQSGYTYAWDFGADAMPATSALENPGSVVYSTPGNKLVTMTVTSPAGCVNTKAMNVTIYPTTITIPADVTIVTGNSSGSGVVWVCPGGVFYSTANSTIYAEAGASVQLGGGRNYVYAKRGASVQGLSGGGEKIVICEDGVGFPGNFNWQDAAVVRAPASSLTFDYTDAPVGGCPSLAPYTKRIPDDVTPVNGTKQVDDSKKEFWIKAGGVLTANGDDNVYTADPGAQIIATGNNNTIYLKDGASFEARGGTGNRIFYEPRANIVNAGDKSGLFPGSSLTYIYEGNVLSGVRNDEAADASNGITITPNPATTQVTLRNNREGFTIDAVTVYDPLGRLVRSEAMTIRTGESGTLSVEGLSAGTYLVRMHGDAGTITRKLVVW